MDYGLQNNTALQSDIRAEICNEIQAKNIMVKRLTFRHVSYGNQHARILC